jgi:carbon monoxide dehydrogenase subunit G
MRIVYRTTLACTPERLWPFLHEPQKQKLWMKGLESNEPTSEGPTRPGSTFKMRIKEGRKVAEYQGEVLAHEPPRHLAVRFWGGALPCPLKMNVDYRLVPVEGGTQLDYVAGVEGRPGLLLRLLMPLIQLFGKLQLRSFMKTLKRLAEAPAEAA